jgi:hypothetical protein
MATTKTDLFHDDLCAILRKHGIEPQPTKLTNPEFALAFDDLMEEVEKIHEAQGPAFACDHCGGLFKKLHAERKAQLSLCAQCHALPLGDSTGAEHPDDGGEMESQASLTRWANPGIGKW